MLVAMQASRAVLVKLADRLHDMRTLGALPAAKRDRMAQETLDIWAPLANRVGLWNMKAPLEVCGCKRPPLLLGWAVHASWGAPCAAAWLPACTSLRIPA